MKRRILGLIVVSVSFLAGCGSQATDPEDPVKKAEAELAVVRSSIEARTPKDEATVALMKEAARWYNEPRVIWIRCEDFAGRLNAEGLPTKPLDLLRGSIEVMKRLDVRPASDQSMLEYLRLYEMRRELKSTDEKNGRQLNHQEVLDMLVQQEKFGNNFSYADLKTREIQNLSVGDTVRLGSLDKDYASPIPEDAGLPEKLRIPNGTRAKILEIEDEKYLPSRYLRLRILEGEYTGKRVGVSPEQIELFAPMN